MRVGEPKIKINSAEKTDFGAFNLIRGDALNLLLFKHSLASLNALINVNRSFYHLIHAEYQKLRDYYQKRLKGNSHILKALDKGWGPINYLNFHKRAHFLPNDLLKKMFTNENSFPQLDVCNFKAFFGKGCVEEGCELCKKKRVEQMSSSKLVFLSVNCLILGANSQALDQNPEFMNHVNRANNKPLRPQNPTQKEQSEYDFEVFKHGASTYMCSLFHIFACFTQNAFFIDYMARQLNYEKKSLLSVSLIIAAFSGNGSFIEQCQSWLPCGDEMDERVHTAILLKWLIHESASPDKILEAIEKLIAIKNRSLKYRADAVKAVLNQKHSLKSLFPSIEKRASLSSTRFDYLKTLGLYHDGCSGTLLHYAAMQGNLSVFQAVYGYYQKTIPENLDKAASFTTHFELSLANCATKNDRLGNLFWLASISPLNHGSLRFKLDGHLFQGMFFNYLFAKQLKLSQIEGVLIAYLRLVFAQNEISLLYDERKTREIFRLIQNQNRFEPLSAERTQILSIYLESLDRNAFGRQFYGIAHLAYAIFLELDPDSDFGKFCTKKNSCSENEIILLRDIYEDRDLLVQQIRANEKDLEALIYIEQAYIKNAKQDHPRLLAFLLQALNVIHVPGQFKNADAADILVEAREAMGLNDEKWKRCLEYEFNKLRLIPNPSLSELITKSAYILESKKFCTIT